MKLWPTLIMSLSLLGCPSYHSIQISNDVYLIPKPDYEWVLLEDLYFTVDAIPYRIEKGFQTDLASIPKWLWSVVSPIRYDLIVPSLIHDFFYATPHNMRRKDIDSIFYWCLKEQGSSKLNAYVYYAAVRLFGWKSFNKGR